MDLPDEKSSNLRAINFNDTPLALMKYAELILIAATLRNISNDLNIQINQSSDSR